jgi:hemolysin activation/secretion protein
MGTKVRSYDSLGAFDKDFNYTVLDLTRDQPLFGDFSAFMRATFHYAPGLLPMEQQFAVGTNVVGQGYPTGLISANKGINALLELRYTREMDNNRWLRGVQPYLFFDCAKVSSPIQPISKRLLNSAGGGVRLMTPFDLTAAFGVAVPFAKRVVLDNKDTITNKVKVTFELSKEFRF